MYQLFSYRPYAYDVTEGRPRGVGGCTIAKHTQRANPCMPHRRAGPGAWLRGWAPMRSASKTCAAPSLDPQHGVVVFQHKVYCYDISWHSFYRFHVQSFSQCYCQSKDYVSPFFANIFGDFWMKTWFFFIHCHLIVITHNWLYFKPYVVSWEPEGRYHHRLYTAIAPFWISTDDV